MRRVRFIRRTSIRGGNVFDEGEIVPYDEAKEDDLRGDY